MADITVIGGINVDIEGAPDEQLIAADSNPGRVSISYGGVGRNIVENVARLGGDVAMISVIGDDPMGNNAKEYLTRIGVDVSGIHRVSGENTGMYLSILNHSNDMELAICNMDILEYITPSLVDTRLDNLKQSKMVALDCNLSLESLTYLTEKLSDTPLFLDPVSVSKAKRVKSLIGKFHTIKPNRIEAELLSGIELKDEESLHEAGEWFINAGVKRVFISLGERGAYYKEGKEEGLVATNKPDFVSATGAGDAFSAAILLGHVKNLSARETAKLGVACATVAMEAKTAVNEKISLESVMSRISE
ncbi:pseudouridine kinase [Clostridiales Family XIII bacterium PM5-7]